jgi:DnaK suppressor protein
VKRYEAIRKQLLELLGPLERRVGAIERDLRKPRNPDWQERATETENDTVLEGIGEQERQEAAAIRLALERIDSGSYGTCSGCGEDIPLERLQIVPFTSTCVACAE